MKIRQFHLQQSNLKKKKNRKNRRKTKKFVSCIFAFVFVSHVSCNYFFGDYSAEDFDVLYKYIIDLTR